VGDKKETMEKFTKTRARMEVFLPTTLSTSWGIAIPAAIQSQQEH
jgi:hypothetical protein